MQHASTSITLLSPDAKKVPMELTWYRTRRESSSCLASPSGGMIENRLIPDVRERDGLERADLQYMLVAQRLAGRVRGAFPYGAHSVRHRRGRRAEVDLDHAGLVGVRAGLHDLAVAMLRVALAVVVTAQHHRVAGAVRRERLVVRLVLVGHGDDRAAALVGELGREAIDAVKDGLHCLGRASVVAAGHLGEAHAEEAHLIAAHGHDDELRGRGGKAAHVGVHPLEVAFLDALNDFVIWDVALVASKAHVVEPHVVERLDHAHPRVHSRENGGHQEVARQSGDGRARLGFLLRDKRL
mmetsp:Transcript_23651/g.58782  ORF Transcript_23651/g.58782 Transcript_23651/m.58782 type:complete len:297 (+) Transcript_23651:815-1705(+)